ncbi:MAG: Imm5 family immunity protein [Firmicutes bacterium]|nr:Imm5 family immunity protein [Bacillota bacterium]
MQKIKLNSKNKDIPLIELLLQRDHKTLALWASDCAEHVLPIFERYYPADKRPHDAIEAARAWSRGELRVGPARKAALNAHYAAQETLEKASCAAARSAGHAAATAHMPRHAVVAARYAVLAASLMVPFEEAETAGDVERAWQFKHLTEI